MRDVSKIMNSDNEMFFAMPARDVFLLLTCVQWAWRFDQLNPQMQSVIKEIGDFLQESLEVEFPFAHSVLATGWDVTKDVSRDQKDEPAPQHPHSQFGE